MTLFYIRPNIILGSGTAEKQTEKTKAINTIYGGICMVREYEKCILHSVEYRNTSTVGNPSYWVYFTDSEGNFHRGYTGSNSSSGYTIRNYRNLSGIVIYMKYHFTRKTEACIIDCIKHNTPEEAAREEEEAKN